MAEVRSIVLTADGQMKQVQAGDTQSVAGDLTTTSGNLVLNPAADVEIAAGKDLLLAAGAGGVDLSAGTGAFKTSTGAVTISGSSVAIDSTGVDDTLTIGASSNNISIGAVGKLVTFAGDVQIDGAQTVVGETTFQQDATFEGNTTFGNDSAPDSVTFSANTTVDLGANKITNVADPTAGSQDAATAKYVDDGLANKLDLAGGTMTGAIAMGTFAITGLADPTNDQDAATKKWVVDNSVASFSGGSTGLTPSTASTGAVELGGTLSVGYGGTGASTLTLGSLLVGNGTDPLAEIAPGTEGQVLSVVGGAWAAASVALEPAGSDTQIQFNDSDAFGAVAAFTFDKTTTELLVGGGEAHTIKIAPLGASGNPLIESDDSMNINVANVAGAIGLQTAGNDLVLIGGDDGGGMAYLQTQTSVRLETKGEFWMAETATLPTGVASTGKLAAKSNALYFVDATGQAHYTMPDGLNSLGSVSGNVTLDFDPSLPAYRTLTVGGNLTFQTPSDNLAAGRGLSLRLDNSAGGSTRVLSFPNDWTWLAGSKPVQIEAGEVGIVSLVAYGANDTDIVAAWSYSDSVAITGGGTAGEVAYFDGTRTIKSEGGLKWDETNDRLNIGNADNSAHSANLRVGGSAHIGGEVFLDGNVDLGDAAGDAITVNGAMSLATGASFDGSAGTVDLPAQFSIDGSAVSADVTAANLNTLTGGSDASSLHTHASAGAVIVALNTAANGLAAGDVVCADPAAALQVKKADADASQATARVLGVVESAGKVMLAGLASAKFKSGLTVAIGEPVYLSLDAGLLTNVAPTTGAISEVGVIVSIAGYAGSTTCIVALQVKAPIFLS